MKIYFVRHGETDYNKNKQRMGQRIDVSLNGNGRSQVLELASQLESDFDLIFTSPLKRALETAQILAAEMNAAIREHRSLIECDFGELSGQTWDEMAMEIRKSIPDFEIKDYLTINYDYRPYGGEAEQDVKKRLLEFIDELKNNYPDKKILIVTHNNILKMAYYLFKGMEVEQTQNASIHEFEV